MAKSFQFYCRNENIQFVLHSDGSITNSDIKLVKKHFPQLIVKYPLDQATMNSKLRAFPHLLKNRVSNSYLFNVMSLVDVPMQTVATKYLYIDSDILFYRKPYQILRWIKSSDTGSLVFVDDCSSVYVLNDQQLAKYFSIKKITKFNAGILGLTSKCFDLKFLEYYFSVLDAEGNNDTLYKEQTYWMIFTQYYKLSHVRLKAGYTVRLDPELSPKKTITHFITPIRHQMYTESIKLLYYLH